MARGRKARPLADRFWEKVDTSAGPAACWLWTGSRNKRNRYGTIILPGNVTVYAHRVAYELTIGPIPEGMEIDHVKARGCTNRHCVNPAHLEVVTHAENMRRARLTHCQRGHEFTAENTYVTSDGARLCRTCHRATSKAAYARAYQQYRDERAAQGRPINPNADKTHCPKGHPLEGDNLHPTYLRIGKRHCATCHREHHRANNARYREQRRTQEAA